MKRLLIKIGCGEVQCFEIGLLGVRRLALKGILCSYLKPMVIGGGGKAEVASCDLSQIRNEV
jgi:hypothetical protein